LKSHNQEETEGVVETELAKFIVKECMTWSEDKTMHGLAPGARYSYILQLAPLLMNAEWMNAISFRFNSMIQSMFDSTTIQLAGGEPNALPIITAINAYRIRCGLEPFPAFWIRKERKNYGPHNAIEGKPDPDRKVLLFYDMANSTNTFAIAERVCDTHGLVIVPYNFAILNKNNHYQEEPYKDKNSGREIKSILEWEDVKHVLGESRLYKG